MSTQGEQETLELDEELPADQDFESLWVRIDEQIKRSGKSDRAAAMDAGLGEDFIRKMRRGDIRNPKWQQLMRLAPAIGTTLMYLVGLTDDPSPNLEIGGRRLPIRRGVQADVWIDPKKHPPRERPSEIAPSDLYPNATQWAEPVLDDHLGRLGIHAGALLHCVDAKAIDYRPKPGDVVVIRRTREGGLEERTGRLVRPASGGLELATQPDDGIDEDAVPAPKNGTSELGIEALVLSVMMPVGPRPA